MLLPTFSAILRDPDSEFDLPEPDSPEGSQPALVFADRVEKFWRMIEEHDVAGVMRAIETSSVDPASHNCHGLYLACKEGLQEIVHFYLSQTARMSYNFKVTCLLICQAKYDFSLDNPIVPACENNHVEVVKMMLAHPAIDPSSDRSFAVQVATQAGVHRILIGLMMIRQRTGIEVIARKTRSRSYSLR